MNSPNRLWLHGAAIGTICACVLAIRAAPPDVLSQLVGSECSEEFDRSRELEKQCQVSWQLVQEREQVVRDFLAERSSLEATLARLQKLDDARGFPRTDGRRRALKYLRGCLDEESQHATLCLRIDRMLLEDREYEPEM